MNADYDNTECGRHREELLQLACGGSPETDRSTALEAHLTVCAECGQLLSESTELVAELSAALHPEPLPIETVRLIERRLAERTTAQPRMLRRPAHVLWAAAIAAGLLLAAFTPWPVRNRPVEPDPERIVLSEADALEIVAAFSQLRWSSPVEAAIDQLSSRVADIEKSVERQAGAQSVLPWDRADDWDLPPESSETSLDGVAASSELARHAGTALPVQRERGVSQLL
ncbi:MAG: hypothetical protein KKB50_11595 [Planctomycetes bacterium]|nr:hypothetical protein [Planctomycetota bacterium]